MSALVRSRCRDLSPSKRALAVKRAVDIIASATGFVLLLPLLLALAILVMADSPGPPIFRQRRIGRDGRPFRIFKFRSMVIDAERVGPLLTTAGDRRITRVGSILRSTKIDELPQLLNVLLGDMSLVGPRPEAPGLLKDYRPEQIATITRIRPGMTDYASLELRDEADLLARAEDPGAYYRDVLVPMKVALCEDYLRVFGVTTDLKIIAATLTSLITGRRTVAHSGRENEARLAGPWKP